MKCCQSPTVTGWKEAARSRLSVWEASLQAVSESNQKGFMSAERNVSLSKAAKINSAGVFLHLKLKHLAQVKLTIKRKDIDHFSFHAAMLEKSSELLELKPQWQNQTDESRITEASFSVGWHEQSHVITAEGGIALQTGDRWSPFITAYQLIQQATGHKTHRHIFRTRLTKCRRGRPSGMHEWSSSSKRKINQSMNQIQVRSDADWRERVIGSWRSVGECAEERTDAGEKQAVDILSSSPGPKRRVVTMTPTQHTRSVTHAHTHMPRTHTQRSVRVGYMSDPNTQVHDVQLTSDSQLIGQIKKWWIKKKE